MNITHVSATDLKRNVSGVLDRVVFYKEATIIERHGKPIAKILPFEPENWEKKQTTQELLDSFYGALSDFPEVHTTRHFRKRTVDL